MTKVYVDGAYGTVAIELKGHLLRLCENGVISEVVTKVDTKNHATQLLSELRGV